MTNRLAFLFAGALVIASTGAIAQGAHSHAAPNGGQVQNIGKIEAELVVRSNMVHLYLVDADERKVDASRYSATANVLAPDNKPRNVELAPEGVERLSGKMDFTPGDRLRATITLRDGAAEVGKGRYNVETKAR